MGLNNSLSEETKDNKVSVVAADDHPIFLQGLNSLLQLSDHHELVAHAEDGDGLLKIVAEHEPDIALVDLSMPGATTADILTTIETEHPQTKVIALTMHMEADRTKKLLELGLSGYIVKESAFEELTLAIDAVIQGEQYISSEMRKVLIEHQDDEDLTEREVQVLENAAKGLSNKEIARVLFITERTVRFHLSNSCLKLDANGRSNAVAIALKNSLINY